jgi:hypothetical protein
MMIKISDPLSVPNCNVCTQPLTQVGKFLVCPIHGQQAFDNNLIQYPNGLHPKDMPIYLALPWIEFCKENHPRIKLHWLLDTVEICVRWCVAIALSEVVHANQGKLPKKIIQQIGRLIERPTLGIWLGMLRTLTNSHNSKALLVPQIFQL